MRLLFVNYLKKKFTKGSEQRRAMWNLYAWWVHVFWKSSTHLRSKLVFGFVCNYYKYLTQVDIWPHTPKSECWHRASLWAGHWTFCWYENVPLPSAVQQAALQVSKQQQWQRTDKAFFAEVPQPSGLWPGIHQPTACLSEERLWWKRGGEWAIWPGRWWTGGRWLDIGVNPENTSQW